MNSWLVLGIALPLAACAVPLRETVEPILAPAELYTRPEIDAINAETQCKALARNMVQVARCDVRRTP